MDKKNPPTGGEKVGYKSAPDKETTEVKPVEETVVPEAPVDEPVPVDPDQIGVESGPIGIISGVDVINGVDTRG